MTDTADDSQELFVVVVNAEEQYSIWPARKPLPAGWSDAGFRGPRSKCLDYVETVWTDMRPLSIRRAMADDETHR